MHVKHCQNSKQPQTETGLKGLPQPQFENIIFNEAVNMVKMAVVTRLLAKLARGVV